MALSVTVGNDNDDNFVTVSNGGLIRTDKKSIRIRKYQDKKSSLIGVWERSGRGLRRVWECLTVTVD